MLARRQGPGGMVKLWCLASVVEWVQAAVSVPGSQGGHGLWEHSLAPM
jgi:hypothetical protein